MLKAIERRQDGSILKERPVCFDCDRAMKDEGLTFDQLADQIRPTRNVSPFEPPKPVVVGRSLLRKS